MRVRFWGTRGSIPTPGESTVRHGGNTSCVELRTTRGTPLIFDCGSGARLLGNFLADEAAASSERGEPITAHLFFTHTHWDHIQGFPFFRPIFARANRLTIYGPAEKPQRLMETLAGQMQYAYFPVELDQIGAQLKLVELEESAFSVEDVEIQTRYTNHPALTLAYRVSVGGKTIVYAPDHEPFASSLYGSPEATETELDYRVSMVEALRHEGDQRHRDFIAGADLLIHDAQYTSGEYASKRTWGHSPVEYVVDLAMAAGVRRLALFHHDPEHDDAFLDRLLAACRERVRAARSPMEVLLASEGVTVDLGTVSPATPNGEHAELTPPVNHPLALVIEDDPSVKRLVEHTLKRDGWLVETAGSVEDAWVAIRGHRPAVILLDLTLPGESGLTFLEALRRGPDTELRGLPVIVLTGCSTEADIAKTFAAGATDHIAKPFAPAQLRARLKGWLHRAEAGQSGTA